MEAELFGAEAGAYTGISAPVESGISKLPTAAPSSSTRSMPSPCRARWHCCGCCQSGDFQRLGSSRTHRADVRVISATNAHLADSIADGTFREDLYYRLNVVELAVPALADRVEDVLPLARHFLLRLPATPGAAYRLSPDAEQALRGHPWPGNVRELENRIQRATLVAAHHHIHRDLGLGNPRVSGDQCSEPGEQRQQVLDSSRATSAWSRVQPRSWASAPGPVPQDDASGHRGGTTRTRCTTIVTTQRSPNRRRTRPLTSPWPDASARAWGWCCC